MTIEFTDDDVEIIKELITDWGCNPDYTNLSSDQLRPLAEKLGVWEPEQPPTEEQLKRQEVFRNILASCKEYYSKEMLKLKKYDVFINGSQWDCKIGTSIKIHLPNEYKVKE